MFQHASTFNHLFELLQENFLGYLSPRRPRRTLGTRRTWRTGWAWLIEERKKKYLSIKPNFKNDVHKMVLSGRF